jgi:hypothetical protein
MALSKTVELSDGIPMELLNVTFCVYGYGSHYDVGNAACGDAGRSEETRRSGGATGSLISHRTSPGCGGRSARDHVLTRHDKSRVSVNVRNITEYVGATLIYWGLTDSFADAPLLGLSEKGRPVGRGRPFSLFECFFVQLFFTSVPRFVPISNHPFKAK